MKRSAVRLTDLGDLQGRLDSAGELLGFGALGLDFGHYSVKLHLLLSDRSGQDEIPRRGRSDSDLIEEAARRIEKYLSRSPNGLRRLVVGTNLNADDRSLLGQKLNEISHVPVDLPDIAEPEAGVYFSTPLTKPDTGPLCVVDVGWEETRCFFLSLEGRRPKIAETIPPSDSFHARAVDKSILATLHEFAFVSDIEEAYSEVKGQAYALAEDLKHQLATQKVVKAEPRTSDAQNEGVQATRINSKVFRKDFKAHPEWRNFEQSFLHKAVRKLIKTQGASRLLLNGASFRLPWLREALAESLPQLEVVFNHATDPAQGHALGLAILALSEAFAAEPSSETAQESNRTTPESLLAGAVDVSFPEQARAEDGKEHLALRIEGTLKPLFPWFDGDGSGPDEVPSRLLHCAPAPAYLHREGASVDLQLFRHRVGSDRACPRFIQRRSVPVPAEGSFHLLFDLRGQTPLQLQVRVLTDQKEFFGEHEWNVGED